MLKTVKMKRAVKKPHVKKDDNVLILIGEDAGKQGRVLQVLPTKGQCVVEGIHFVKRHTRPSKKIGKGGIVQKEGAIALSRVALYCSSCKCETRATFVVHQSETSRICKLCKEPIGRK